MTQALPILATISYTYLVAENTSITGHRIAPQSASISYKILRKLGKGGMAEVYLARQEGLMGVHRLTVIKRILPQFSAVTEIAEMLLDEARIAAQLTHPNIVQIYELGKDRDQYFIAMEFVDGCDLASLARTERNRQSLIPLHITLQVIADAAIGLDYAHRQTGLDGKPLNIVHRDVSPHNILCSREGVVKLTDFGIAKAVGKAQVTQVGVVKGKIHYMAPEQYSGSGVDHRSDIYSLGVILYQLTTGRLPRVAKSTDPGSRPIFTDPIPRPIELMSDYPKGLERIVMRALAENLEARYDSAAEMRDELLNFAKTHNLLSFSKELGEYVNSLAPPVPIVVREQSFIQANIDAVPPPHFSPHSGGNSRFSSHPSLIFENEEDNEDFDFQHSDQIPLAGAIRESSQRYSNVGAIRESSQRYSNWPNHSGAQSNASSRPGLYLDEDQIDHLPPPSDLSRDDTLDSSSRHRISSPGIKPQTYPLAQYSSPSLPSSRGATNSTPESYPPYTPTPIAKTMPSHKESNSINLWITTIAVVVALVSVIYSLKPWWLPWFNHKEESGLIPIVPKAGILQIQAHPSQVEVFIDDAQRCSLTPCQINGLPLGRELILSIKAKGYADWNQRIILTAQDPQLQLNAYLAPQAKVMPLSPEKDVNILPSRNQNGANAEDTTKPEDIDYKSTSLPSRENEKTSKINERVNKKYNTHKKTARFKNPRDVRPIVRLNSTTAHSRGNVNSVAISSNEALLAADVQPWAEMWIDGKKRGHTPIQVAVTPGKHKVELKNIDLRFVKTYFIQAKRGIKIKIQEVIATDRIP